MRARVCSLVLASALVTLPASAARAAPSLEDRVHEAARACDLDALRALFVEALAGDEDALQREIQKGLARCVKRAMEDARKAGDFEALRVAWLHSASDEFDPDDGADAFIRFQQVYSEIVRDRLEDLRKDLDAADFEARFADAFYRIFSDDFWDEEAGRTQEQALKLWVRWFERRIEEAAKPCSPTALGALRARLDDPDGIASWLDPDDLDRLKKRIEKAQKKCPGGA